MTARGPQITGGRYLGPRASLGLGEQARSRMEAEIGSAQLRERTFALFRRFAERHRINPHEARVLLLDTGVKL